jgi:hypothetical protein
MDDETRNAAAREEALERAMDEHAIATARLVDAWLGARGGTLAELALAKDWADRLFDDFEARLRNLPWAHPPGSDESSLSGC